MVSSLLTLPKSLWSYNPIPGGCVLYLPLWNPNLSGPVFKSVDSYGHTSTVTGATYGSTGRDFDGTDDYINCGTSSALNLTDAPISILAWVKGDSLGTGFQAIYISDELNGYGIYVTDTTKLAWTKTGVDDVRSTDSVTDANFHLQSAVYDPSNNVYFYEDDGADSGNPHAYTTTFSNGLTYHIGARGVAGVVRLEGIIGEVWIYNRALSLGEITHIYNQTKGRYS